MSAIRKIGDKLFFTDTGEVVYPEYQDYSCAEDYLKDGVFYVTPMTAKEEDREEELEKMLAPNSGYYAEEKFDGTRGTLHFYKNTHINTKVLCKEDPIREIGYTRCFSRRISDVTNWFSENTDSLPHLHRIDCPALDKTVIDGELFIPDRPFKDVSSTLNCKWDKAIERQIELGMIVFHAFDIVWYKGIYIARMPLWKRKKYLEMVVKMINSPYVKMVHYFDQEISVPKDEEFCPDHYLYPTLFKEYESQKHNKSSHWCFSKKAYYEYIVSTGGEGIILKNKDGQYYHKRGREYTKLKKTITRECIIMGFTKPTKEYEGKYPTPDKWRYWELRKDPDFIFDTSNPRQLDAVQSSLDEFIPVSKYYAEDWVGNIRFGVIVAPEEKATLEKSKKGKQFHFELCNFFYRGKEHIVIEVGDCSGFDEPMRENFTKHVSELMGSVVEIKANEIYKDTGKLRHPRFLRMRPDKSAEECTWKDHIG